jgi:hypothetical protein
MPGDQKEESKMRHPMSWILAFVAGMAVGSLATHILSRLQAGKKHRSDLVNARQRILVGIKEQHEQDLRREILQTTEALRGELNGSLNRLLNSTKRLLGQVHEDSDGKKEPREPGTLGTGTV